MNGITNWYISLSSPFSLKSILKGRREAGREEGRKEVKEHLRPSEKDKHPILPQVLPEKMLKIPLESVGDLRSGVAVSMLLPQVESLELPVRRTGWEGRTVWCLRAKLSQRGTSPLVLVGNARSSLTWGQHHLWTFALCKLRNPLYWLSQIKLGCLLLMIE